MLSKLAINPEDVAQEAYDNFVATKNEMQKRYNTNYSINKSNSPTNRFQQRFGAISTTVQRSSMRINKNFGGVKISRNHNISNSASPKKASEHTLDSFGFLFAPVEEKVIKLNSITKSSKNVDSDSTDIDSHDSDESLLAESSDDEDFSPRNVINAFPTRTFNFGNSNSNSNTQFYSISTPREEAYCEEVDSSNIPTSFSASSSGPCFKCVGCDCKLESDSITSKNANFCGPCGEKFKEAAGMAKDAVSREGVFRRFAESALMSAAFAKAAALGAAAHPGMLMAMMPGLDAPPQGQPGQQLANGKPGQVGFNQMPQKEEEEFMELIFPGYKADTFIWNVTLFQIAWFFFTMSLGHVKANPSPCALYMLGASWGPAIAQGQLFRLVCPMMLHANMMHLFFNVFFQLRIGFGMERQFGKSKMRVIYGMCGVIGNLVSVMLDPFKLAVGASTAGFGLIGVWVAEILMSWEMLGPNKDRTLIWILFMLVSVTTMSGMTPNMDLYGHFGGAWGGFLLALIMSDMKPENQPKWYNAAKAFAFIALVGTLGAGFFKLALLTPRAPIPDCSWQSLQGPVGEIATRLNAWFR